MNKRIEFHALRDSRYLVHTVAGKLEPYLRLIVEKFHPERIVLFGSYAYFDPRFNSFASLANELTEDFFAQHYPREDTTNVGQNYEVLRRSAGDLVDLICGSIPQFF